MADVRSNTGPRHASAASVSLSLLPEPEDTSFAVHAEPGVVRLTGELKMKSAPAIWAKLRQSTEGLKRGKVAIDLAGASAVDGGMMSLLVALRADLAARKVTAEIVNTPEAYLPLVDLYEANAPPRKAKKRPPRSAIAQVGDGTIAIGQELKGVISFFGEMVSALVGLVRHPRSGHWKEVPPLLERCGADAIPIVILINFLVGFVMAFQSAKQLKMFGANIFVADLVGLSVVRELAPLMTAIIVCGRSGAAFAAEIGSMKVSEEVDALRTLGLRPFSWLVVPRVIALVCVTPALTIVGDVIGVLGGYFVGATTLDITTQGYYNETQKALEIWDIEHGLIKSVIFGLAIALIACQQGFATTGGAEGVGKRTTSTVVTSLFAIVLLDATFTIVFRVFGL